MKVDLPMPPSQRSRWSSGFRLPFGRSLRPGHSCEVGTVTVPGVFGAKRLWRLLWG